ncbi:MAG: bifunctional riboflavin kinase/FAD synthetase [Proteobacteria bacterium]|nr:bifunctional riboflavin kinase/FAD synthetase [Pseudomonadota bacterium]
MNESPLAISPLTKPKPDVFRVVAIGNFDGAHRGHAAIAARARALGQAAARGDVEVVALTFEPHPRVFFRPDIPHFRLTPGERRLARLREIGFDAVAVAAFTAPFAALSPEAFITDVLIGHLGAQGVVVGEDFHFGRARAGTPSFLVAEGKRLGFAVALVPAIRDETGVVISSTAIRTALAAGEVTRANAMLGRSYSVVGPVLHGRKLGRELGYPTANMRLEAGNGLKHGVYAARARVDGVLHDGVASFGTRPHFDDGAPLLETHLFDFTGDLYGQEMEVFFHAYLRGEAKFETLDALIRQMDADSAEARRLLADARKP